MWGEVGVGNRGGTDRNGWFTFPWSGHGRQAGFSYRGAVDGRRDTTSFLWEYNTENQAIPFTQMFIRPRLTTASLPLDPRRGPSGADRSGDARRSGGGDRRWCERSAQGRRLRAATRQSRPRDHHARRPRVRGRQVLRRPRHSERLAGSPVVPRGLRSGYRCVDQHVPSTARRHRLGPGRGRRSPDRRRTVHQRRRCIEHVGAGCARSGDRRCGSDVARVAGRVGYDVASAGPDPRRGRRLDLRRGQLHAGGRAVTNGAASADWPVWRSATATRTHGCDRMSPACRTTSMRRTASCRSRARSRGSTGHLASVSAR